MSVDCQGSYFDGVFGAYPAPVLGMALLCYGTDGEAFDLGLESMSIALFAAVFTGIVLGSAFIVDRLEDRCTEQFEAYQECMSKEQDRRECMDREVSWYCE